MSAADFVLTLSDMHGAPASPDRERRVVRHLKGRPVNISPSFLPSHEGAKRHDQAHRPGIKLIGATAQDVTADLDVGCDVECVLLARAALARCAPRVAQRPQDGRLQVNTLSTDLRR